MLIGVGGQLQHADQYDLTMSSKSNKENRLAKRIYCINLDRNELIKTDVVHSLTWKWNTLYQQTVVKDVLLRFSARPSNDSTSVTAGLTCQWSVSGKFCKMVSQTFEQGFGGSIETQNKSTEMSQQASTGFLFSGISGILFWKVLHGPPGRTQLVWGYRWSEVGKHRAVSMLYRRGELLVIINWMDGGKQIAD